MSLFIIYLSLYFLRESFGVLFSSSEIPRQSEQEALKYFLYILNDKFWFQQSINKSNGSGRLNFIIFCLSRKWDFLSFFLSFCLSVFLSFFHSFFLSVFLSFFSSLFSLFVPFCCLYKVLIMNCVSMYVIQNRIHRNGGLYSNPYLRTLFGIHSV